MEVEDLKVKERRHSLTQLLLVLKETSEDYVTLRQNKQSALLSFATRTTNNHPLFLVIKNFMLHVAIMYIMTSGITKLEMLFKPPVVGFIKCRHGKIKEGRRFHNLTYPDNFIVKQRE